MRDACGEQAHQRQRTHLCVGTDVYGYACVRCACQRESEQEGERDRGKEGEREREERERGSEGARGGGGGGGSGGRALSSRNDGLDRSREAGCLSMRSLSMALHLMATCKYGIERMRFRANAA